MKIVSIKIFENFNNLSFIFNLSRGTHAGFKYIKIHVAEGYNFERI